MNLATYDDLLGHPVSGNSWEGFVIENLMAALPLGMTPWYYRTSAGAEIDLVLERGPKERYAIEIKRSFAPSLSKGFYLGCEDIGAEKRFLVYPGKERFPLAKEVTAIPLPEMVTELLNLKM